MDREPLRIAYVLLSLAASLFICMTVWIEQLGSFQVEATPVWMDAAANPEPAAGTSQDVATANWMVGNLSWSSENE